jgi:hypothetical protein
MACLQRLCHLISLMPCFGHRQRLFESSCKHMLAILTTTPSNPMNSIDVARFICLLSSARQRQVLAPFRLYVSKCQSQKLFIAPLIGTTKLLAWVTTTTEV